MTEGDPTQPAKSRQSKSEQPKSEQRRPERRQSEQRQSEQSQSKPGQAKSRRKPIIQTLAAAEDAATAQPIASPQDAAPPPDAVEIVEPTRPRRRDRWLRLALWTGGTLAVAGVSLSTYDLVADLLSRNPMLGGVALAIALVFGLALLALAARELAAIGRLKHVEATRQAVAKAREADATVGSRSYASQSAEAALDRLLRGRKDLGWAQARLKDRLADTPDAEARLDLYEREVMGPLDARAKGEVAAAARRVAAATALMPSALLDGLASLFFNLRMIRRIAEIYGGRAGVFGSMRLARQVIEHAMAAGLIALGDDLLEPLLGGGLASRLSRRAGEGVVNGALTARIGAAAMEVCRPMPFHAIEKPSLRSLAWGALRGAKTAET